MNDIEKRARELFSAELRQDMQAEYAYQVGCGADLDPEDTAAFRAIIAALTPQWQAIETAPKDGTEIIGFSSGVGVPLLIRWIAPQDFMTTGECELVMNVETKEEIEAAEAWLETPAWFYADFAAGDILAEDCQPTHWMPLPAAPEVSS